MMPNEQRGEAVQSMYKVCQAPPQGGYGSRANTTLNRPAKLTITSPRLPPEPCLHIFPRELNLHGLFTLAGRIHLFNHLLHPVNRPIIRPRALFTHQVHQAPRQGLFVRIAEVLLDPFPKRLDPAAHFFAVILREQAASSFAGIRRPLCDRGRI